MSTHQPADPATPRLRLHIERLVLDGLPLGAGDAAAFRTAFQAELERLLRETQPAPGMDQGTSLDTLPVASFDLPPSAHPLLGGQRAAAALHAQLAGAWASGRAVANPTGTQTQPNHANSTLPHIP